MQALKDIGNVASLLGATPIAKTPLWGKPVDQIHPASLFAFQSRLAFDGRAADAARIVEILTSELSLAAERGEIADHVPLVRYRAPGARTTLGELRVRLERLDRPRPAAVLFALEAGLDIEQVITLTREQVGKMRRVGALSPLALRLLDAQPRAMFSHYVFWQTMNGRQQPLFGLSLELAELFDQEWSEIQHDYRRAIPLDVAVERATIH